MLLILLACTGSEPVDTATDPADDSSAPSDSGDTPPDDTGPDTTLGISGIATSLSEEIPSVFTVTWQSALSDGVVRFGVGEQTIGTATGERVDGTWQALVIGLPEETTGWFAVGHGEKWSSDQVITTGEGSDFPAPLEVSGDLEGYTLTTFLGLGEAKMLPVILNGQGELVWWHTYDGDREWFSSRTRLSADKQSVYYNVYHITLSAPQSFAGLVKVSLDGATVETIDLPENHHDFLIHEDGTIAYIQFDRREIDGEIIAGDAIVERAPDGTEVTIWSTWDHLTWDGKGAEREGGKFWTLSNNLEYDADNDAYLLGSRDRNTIFHIDRSTGVSNWVLGGLDGTLTQDVFFLGQHGFQQDGDELLVFDNRGAVGTSRIIRYTLATKSATTAWTHEHDPSVFTEYFGDVMTLSDDRLLIAWGRAGRLSVTDADHNTISERIWTMGSEFGFVTQEPTLME
ncbi:MAG: hypothetical protein ACI8RZ_000297 [Myxococcota bacterium]|jgi:hypothetical protein